VVPGRPLSKLLVLLLAVAALTGCGGSETSARDLYGTYRSTEDERDGVEARLRRSFSDIALAAGRRDRGATLAAAARGRAAAGEIERLLVVEIAAAHDLGEFEDLQVDAERLERGLGKSRSAVRLLLVQLEIAARDPFLEQAGNAEEVRDLARRATRLSVDGELAIRRADRALAQTLGIEPRVDVLLDRERGTTQPE